MWGVRGGGGGGRVLLCGAVLVVGVDSGRTSGKGRGSVTGVEAGVWGGGGRGAFAGADTGTIARLGSPDGSRPGGEVLGTVVVEVVVVGPRGG